MNKPLEDHTTDELRAELRRRGEPDGLELARALAETLQQQRDVEVLINLVFTAKDEKAERGGS